MPKTKILRELLDLLDRPEIPINIRSTIADELGRRKFLPAKKLLIRGLTDADPNMRSACIRALSIEMEIRDAAPLLVQILLHDECEHVKIDAAYGLGSLRCKESLPALKRVILNKTSDATVRDAAFKAVLLILGKDPEQNSPETFLTPIKIDLELVRNL